MKNKKGSKFWIGFWIYLGILLVGSIVLNVKLWNVLADYQFGYEVALAQSNPELVMDELLDLYTANKFETLVDSEWKENVCEYETAAVKSDYLAGYVENKVLSYVKNENYTDRKPVYDVYAADKLVGTVFLKQRPESDQYGFHLCELREALAYVEQPEVQEITIKALDSDTVLINGKEISSESIIETELLDSKMAKTAAKLTGKSYGMNTYKVDGFIELPEVQVIHQDGQIQSDYVMQEEVYDYVTLASPALEQELTEYVMAAGEAYVLNINLWAKFADVSKYLEPKSNAYNNIKGAQSGLSWAGKPDTVEIFEREVSDFVQYSEDVFTVKTTYQVYRLYRGEEYNETLSYEWLFVKQNEKWLIREFSLAK